MQGFKSFAEKTVIEFGDGITAVVGPNGSGKSNISDAIRWVLGEQRPKSLRGGRMEDVIFSGTEHRKPVSFAEVSIVMDNSDGTLNIEYDTVKVTRRLFRSGESEYLINGRQSRLKDIYTLFANTGIGKEGYSIIGQGKVDGILSTKSEDRRGIFEEASGIALYRMRKDESERKLQAAEQNLVVIDGIIGELEIQINSLRKQAAGAEQFLRLRDELRDIEVGVLVYGIKEAEARLRVIDEKYTQVTEEIRDGEAKAAAEKTENEKRTALDEQLEAEYKEAFERAYEAERNAGEADSSIKLNLQRIDSLKAEIRRMELENDEKSRQSRENAKLITEYQEARKQLAVELRDLEANIAREQKRLDIVINAISGGSARAAEKNRELVEKRLEAGRLRSLSESLAGNIKIYEERLAEIKSRREAGESETREAQKNVDVLLERFDSEDAKLKELEKQLEASGRNREALESSIEDKNLRIGDLKTSIDSCGARLRLLREMEENFEGYAKSVKEILSLCRENERFGKGIYGAVAQVITVDRENETAIEVALGNTFQDIITEDEEYAKLAIDYLKTNRLGRATFLPLTAVTAKYLDGDTVEKLKRRRGFLGVASNLVKYEPRYENVVGSLLGRVAVFEDIDSAIDAARDSRYAFMCVTRDGDILRTSGAITGGSPEKGKRGGALSRTREIPEYEKQLEADTARMDKLTKELAALSDSLRLENESIAAITSQIRETEVTVAGITAELAAKKRILDENTKRGDELRQEAEKQNTLINDSKARIAGCDENAAAGQAEIAAIEKELAGLEESARELGGEKDRRQDGITALKLRMAELSGKDQRLSGDIDRLIREKELGEEYKESVEERRREALETEAEILKQNGELTGKLAANRADKQKYDGICSDITSRKKENKSGITAGYEKINSIIQSVGLLREEAGRLDSQRMQKEHELEYNKTRLWDEYEFTYEKAFELTGGEAPANLGAAKARITELRNSIKRLGNVNVASIEDLKITSERYDFMTVQRNDVEESRTKLQKIIAELEATMKEQFMEQFAAIRENFRTVFTELFGGGKADIVMSDEKDCLNCGIEINAQPPGKSLKNILLLSGGEKALTAIALLFGILRMRPTPFCMLDEIESALDDANVYKFAAYTKVLSKETQLILITHRKGTMESSDSLYGVTMEEKGVSKVLSVKL